MNEEKKKYTKLIKNDKDEVIGISIDKKRRKNPKNVDEAFANVFSNFM